MSLFVALTIFIILTIAVLALVFVICSWHEHKRRLQMMYLKHRLNGLFFIHSLYQGKGYQRLELGDKARDFWSDTTFGIVVRKDHLIVGVIGFELFAACIEVRQMQGFKGNNLRGLDMASYLLLCAEEIAKILGKEQVRILPAHRTDYYHLDEDNPRYHTLYAHQSRLRRIYTTIPMRRGYGWNKSGFGEWLEKQLE